MLKVTSGHKVEPTYNIVYFFTPCSPEAERPVPLMYTVTMKTWIEEIIFYSLRPTLTGVVDHNNFWLKTHADNV
jgi:hypothetical protein